MRTRTQIPVLDSKDPSPCNVNIFYKVQLGLESESESVSGYRSRKTITYMQQVLDHCIC